MSDSPQETLRRAVGSTASAPPSARVTQPVQVEWYGAVGDGVADDTAAILAAITAAGANGSVLFKAGKTYKTTSLITIPSDGVTLWGYGAIITSATSAQYEKFRFSGRARGAVMGLRFDCLYTVGATSIAAGVIDIRNSSDIMVQDCEFNDVSNVGVYLYGTTTRATVAFNRFYKNFCAVFSDDDLTNQTTECRIVGNQIRTGLGTTSTALSAGIKISGIGSVSSHAGHVIADNVIDTPGQMGIEIQTWVNGCAIHGNTITGPGYGISVSGCSKIAVTGNTVRNPAIYGLEVASASTLITLAVNVVSGGATPDGIVVAGSSTDISITGGSVSGFDDAIYIDTDSRVTISGVLVYRPGGSCIYLKNASEVAISGCTFDGNGSFGFIFIDSTDAVCAQIVIASNILRGTVTNNGITLHSTANSITDLLVTGNNTSGMICPGGSIAWASTVSPETRLLRIRVYDNSGTGWGDEISTSFNMPYFPTSTNMSFFYNYWAHERGIIAMDATAGIKTVQLPSASRLAGYWVTIQKSDASGNAVTVSTYGGQTIDGAASVALAAQFDRVTVQSDATNWIIVSQD